MMTSKSEKHYIPSWKVRFSILTIRGDKRETHERTVVEYTELDARNRIKRAWTNSKPRIIKVTKLKGAWYI